MSAGWGAASCGHLRLVTSLLCCHPSGHCPGNCIAGAGGRGWCRRPGSSGGSGGCSRSRSSSRGPGGSHTARTAGTPRTPNGSALGSRGPRPGGGAWPRLCPRTLSQLTREGALSLGCLLTNWAGDSHVHKQSSDLIIQSNKASLKKEQLFKIVCLGVIETLNILF